MVAPETAVAAMPEGIDATVAGPLLCAGVTTFNALRKAGAAPGDLVAIQGIGGLGHLAVQFAAKSGLPHRRHFARRRTRPTSRRVSARTTTSTTRTATRREQLQKMGGAKVILATAPSGKAISGLVGGLKYKGKLVIVAAPNDNINVSAHPADHGQPRHRRALQRLREGFRGHAGLQPS